MVELKVRKFGNSLGVVLPKEVVNRLQTADGKPLFLIEAPDGGPAYALRPAPRGEDGRSGGDYQALPQHTECSCPVRKPVWIANGIPSLSQENT
jgi:hypothetical protein